MSEKIVFDPYKGIKNLEVLDKELPTPTIITTVPSEPFFKQPRDEQEAEEMRFGFQAHPLGWDSIVYRSQDV